MDELKLLIRIEDDLENEIKILKTINKDVNMNFGLEKCARISLKKADSKAKYIWRTFVKEIKEIDSRESYMYIGIEWSHDIEHKIEK